MAETLTDEERAELEQLRAEKAARAEAEAAAAERAELERMRAEKAALERDAAEDARLAAVRERGRAIMEPGDDLSMPIGQKVVIAVVIVAIIVFVAMSFFGR